MALSRPPRGQRPESYEDPGPPGVWTDAASCLGTPETLCNFFGKTRAEWMLARKVCEGCPVRTECLSYALTLHAVEGVWGGMDPLMLRFTLGLNAQGELWTYAETQVKCPACRENTNRVERSETTAFRKCPSCGFSWVRAERTVKRRRRAA